MHHFTQKCGSPWMAVKMGTEKLTLSLRPLVWFSLATRHPFSDETDFLLNVCRSYKCGSLVHG
ncbi:hypothetical protein T4E_3282 [Trichinella pseudospiralis]|uniref:Uncharacterized protein n=1 Tax=Trichinella pseudospiralis TaxID=6337 RepID=A0A0V0XVS2_TRIPS|nr:hypothetical protein T4E_3282 [Trichinella pseudospiralis]